MKSRVRTNKANNLIKSKSTDIHSGEGFYWVFSENLKQAVLTTTVPHKNWRNGSAYSTSDQVFIPATTELGDTVHARTYPIGTVYAYFSGAGDAKRVAQLNGEARFYWTRSPDPYLGGTVRYVGDTGEFYSIPADGDFASVRPALNLKSETLVSEISN